ncbi:Zn(II)2Cys6 transcription factor domain-containing protein [Aspergillus novofumigatus IBT 16806]|uniref:Zn(2)-C6 fungal-type domain-containing protein n=1 Tax=Aspergillus novofumigatus (strain IBT 16806) TaxID=1392255 RepID=A0A2I1BXD4_ASPN1|nr:uncharacterized protein P174DRAFT_445077 [Aspergillus novofumigatus IBT 16806]PKX90053.1 hypothetical protein P174DRAFT_445077 [Aspergillus novofumigatus IBT 16806]
MAVLRFLVVLQPSRFSKRSANGKRYTEAESVSPISCELCRQRKCKCDRNIPFCSQCSADPSKCNYPESGKRGLPLGYINQLEMRLADTELALYEALTTLRAMNGSTLIRASQKADISPKQKAARMEEWTQFPFREPSDLERWLDAKRDEFNIMNNNISDAQRTMPLDAIQSADSATQRRNSQPCNTSGMLIRTNSPDSYRLDCQVTASSMQANPRTSTNKDASLSTPGRTFWGETSIHGLPEQNLLSGDAAMLGEGIQTGKAGWLSKTHPTIYF